MSPYIVQVPAAQRHRRRAQADGDGACRGAPRRRDGAGACIRRAGSSAAARTSRRPKSRCAAASPTTCTSCFSRLRGRDRRRSRFEVAHQSARQLDLVRRRRPGHRHGDRAAARARARVRDEPRARRRRHDDAAGAAPDVSAAPRGLRAQHVEGPQSSIVVPADAAREGTARRDHLHVRHAAAASASASAPAATRRGCAARSREVVKTARRATRPSPTSSRSTAARKCWRAPIDKGFNRLAWLFPYLAGLAGLVAAAYRRAPLVAPRAAGRAARSCRRRPGASRAERPPRR